MLAVISLDSVARPLLGRLLHQGSMPNLARLRKAGTIYEIANQPLIGTIYPSLYTGLRPEYHGLYYPFQWSAAEQGLCLASDLLPTATVFRAAEKAGKRLLVIDPPECPEQPVQRSTVMSGWQFRSRVLLPLWAHPASTYRSLVSKYGKASRCEETFGRPNAAELLALRPRLLAASERLAGAVEETMRSERPDLLWVTFVAAHLAGHQFWDVSLIDDGLPPERRLLLSNALVDIYAAVDQALGRILARLPDDADVLVFWAKGMGTNNSRADLLPDMLSRILNPDSGRAKTVFDPLARLREFVPIAVRAKAAAALPDRLACLATAWLGTRGLDWTRTPVFALPSDGPGMVRLNVKGRERAGILEPAHAKDLLATIATGLHTFDDIGGGSCIASIETPREFLGDGPRSDWFPDLLIQWSSQTSNLLTGVTSPQFGEILRRGYGTGRSGFHCEGAEALVVPARSKCAQVAGEQITPVDISATIYSALGLTCPDPTGRPLLVW